MKEEPQEADVPRSCFDGGMYGMPNFAVHFVNSYSFEVLRQKCEETSSKFNGRALHETMVYEQLLLMFRLARSVDVS